MIKLTKPQTYKVKMVPIDEGGEVMDWNPSNWPDDLQVHGKHNVWPVTREGRCQAVQGGHYCTLAYGHRGDHLTLLARWSDKP